ncbi:MAG: thiaminase II [Chloroflexi bacterium]|nr:thiaminase II [Chloroflexota bacterium]
MGLSQELREKHQALWERMVTHPFVQELGQDTLPLERFQRYLLQDYVFLAALVKAVAMAVAKAPDMDTARTLAAFLHGLLQGEETLFRETFRQWGVSMREYLKAEPTPTTRAYSDFVLRVAHEGDFAALLTLLVVSEWTYLDWATRLVQAGKVPSTDAYRKWVEIHSTPGFRTFVEWLRGRLDSLAQGPRPDLEEVFRTALHYEYRFWEAAYRGEAAS